jgi:hypothetical protein
LGKRQRLLRPGGQRDVGSIGMQIKVNKGVSGSYEVPSGLLISISYGILHTVTKEVAGFEPVVSAM